MPKFGSRSKRRLEGVHPDLVEVLNEAIKYVDFTILEGVRSTDRQQELFDDGKSKTLNSKHLEQDDGYGHAVDLALYHKDRPNVRWDDRDGFVALAFFIKGIATQMGIKIRLGVDWDGDFNIGEHSFFDGPHMEILLDV